jgi:hypothetical protein
MPPCKSKYLVQTESTFFGKLHYNIRTIIYNIMDLPPRSNGNQYQGFILSCKQANLEAAEVPARQLKLEMEHYQTEYPQIFAPEKPEVPFYEGFSARLKSCSLLLLIARRFIELEQGLQGFLKFHPLPPSAVYTRRWGGWKDLVERFRTDQAFFLDAMEMYQKALSLFYSPGSLLGVGTLDEQRWMADCERRCIERIWLKQQELEDGLLHLIYSRPPQTALAEFPRDH